MIFFFSLRLLLLVIVRFFFFNDTATTEIYTLSLHDALPISDQPRGSAPVHSRRVSADRGVLVADDWFFAADGFRTDPVRRVCAGVWARLHLCAVEPARPFGFAGSHPDARHRDPRLDAHARRLDWDCGARNAADAEHADRAFAACRRTAPGQSAGTGAVSDAAVQPDD